MSVLNDTLSTGGLSLFGLSMPRLAPDWVTAGTGFPVTVDESGLALELAAGEGNSWLAPIAGSWRRIPGPVSAEPASEEEEETPPEPRLDLTLTTPGGASLQGPGMLLTIFPQAYLRLARLYAQELETADAARPARERGLPVRPVPRYFFYAGELAESDLGGNVEPSAVLERTGRLTVYDQNGEPIDPLAVASAFAVLLLQHAPLQERPFASQPFLPEQLGVHFLARNEDLAGRAGALGDVRVRLADTAGRPVGSLGVEGLTAGDPNAIPNGLFLVDPAAGLTRQEGLATSRLRLLGPATTGRLRAAFLPPPLPAGLPAAALAGDPARLPRDFWGVRVVELEPLLLGEPVQELPGLELEKKPPVRLHEPVELLADGNEVLGAVNVALTGAEDTIAVGQTLVSTFTLPPATGAAARFPAFPPQPAGAQPASGAVPLALRDGIVASAQFVASEDPARPNPDVVLSLTGLPGEAGVRVFPRRFGLDAIAERGDGAGGVVPSVGAEAGTLALLLPDPFSLRRPGQPATSVVLPLVATLQFDLVVVHRDGAARVFGNLTTPVDGTTTELPPPVADNVLAGATFTGVSNAGVLGLAGEPSGFSFADLDLSSIAGVVAAVRALTGEPAPGDGPRDAPRLPTMARRELLASGRTGAAWRGVVAGGKLAPETLSAAPRVGSPGSPGGRETQVVGAATQNGRLAYDVARAGLRRATNVFDRLVELEDVSWNEPAEPAELGEGVAANANQGTFAGAVLQTVAPRCETPELAFFETLVRTQGPFFNDNDSLQDLLATLTAQIDALGLPNDVRNFLVTRLNQLQGQGAAEQEARERLFAELHRELMTACFGRRDAQWALAGAIRRARRFLYIETPGFAPTAKSGAEYAAEGRSEPPGYALDLLRLLADRLVEAPGLKVILCTPKFPDYGPGYEPFALAEAKARRAAVLALPGSQVVSFHPVGFPGRPSRLESTVVVADDTWLLAGSSSFRRRGLTFDGGTDLVLTDTDLEAGVSPAIAAFRRRLLAERLGFAATTEGALGAIADASFVRLADGVEAFHAVREVLKAGGLGRIELLWNTRLPGVEPLPASALPSLDLGNPDGRELAGVEALLQQLLAGVAL